MPRINCHYTGADESDVGQLDRITVYPASDPVTPEDIAATIDYALGLDPETRMDDELGRPHSVALGQPITEMFG